jgi:phosphoadenosine phosphosulfate reductase
MLGGSHHGQRLNTLYRENIDEAILAALDPLLARYADERLAAEPSATCTAPASSPCRRTPPTPASIWNWRMNAPDPPFVPDPAVADAATLARINTWLEARDADARVQWALDTRPARMLSTSFAQAAVSLHLLTAHKPGIPVILIDTGYLFAETYRFADQLIERFDLNLKIFRPTISRAWMEARHGELWNDGRAGIERYNALRKVEPMKRALAELGVRTWFAGLRRNQSEPGRHADPARARRTLEIPPAGRLERPRRVAVHESTTCPTTRCGTRATCPSVTTTPPRAGAGHARRGHALFGLKRECGLHG